MLPIVLEDIIMYHKKFLDHQERNKNIIKDIKKIEYTTFIDDDGLYLSTRSLDNYSLFHNNHVEYYTRRYKYKNQYYGLMIESHYCFRGDSTIYSQKILQTQQGKVKILDLGVSRD